MVWWNILVGGSLLPWLVLAGRDHKMHMHARVVSKSEHLLHGVVTIGTLALVAAAFTHNAMCFFFGLAVFVPGGVVDEFVFHRQLPEAESDVHAKQHLSFFVFCCVALVGYFAQRGAP